MKLLSWPYGAFLLIGIAVLIFATPDKLEGPMLLSISPGHALTVLDGIALVPLLLGAAWLHTGLWQRRKWQYEWVRSSPVESSLVLFMAGLGLGLLIASAFSTFFWWWAIGALLFAGTQVIAAMVAVRRK